MHEVILKSFFFFLIIKNCKADLIIKTDHMMQGCYRKIFFPKFPIILLIINLLVLWQSVFVRLTRKIQ